MLYLKLCFKQVKILVVLGYAKIFFSTWYLSMIHKTALLQKQNFSTLKHVCSCRYRENEKLQNEREFLHMKYEDLFLGYIKSSQN